MTPVSDLQLSALLQQLQCKTSAENIPGEARTAVWDFLQQEQQLRHQHRISRLMLSSGIAKNQIRTFEQLDWQFNPALPQHDILAFRSSNWIETSANLVLIGDPGIGKSHIAKALCYDAISKGFPTYFASAYDLISKIKRSAYPSNKIDFFGKSVKVLCIDELGYTCHEKNDADLLFQIISKRCEILPTIVTSNLPPKLWGSVFHGSAASAILDRLSGNGSFLNWQGRSYRVAIGNKR
jgi:DNA replication protein DnaC